MKALALVALSGCAVAMDGAYKLTGPNTGTSVASTSLGTGRVEAWREVEIDPVHGLVCRDLERPFVRTAQVDTRVVNPNGLKLPMQFFTVVEALAIGTIVAVHEAHGGDRASFYPWIAPFAADLVWGTYRSFTIHDEIIRSSDVDWRGPSQLDAARTEREACAIGSELVVAAGADQLIVHVGERGLLVAAELPQLAAFIDAHVSFAIAGENVRLDASHARALVAAVMPPPPVASPPPVRVEVPRRACVIGPDGTSICVR